MTDPLLDEPGIDEPGFDEPDFDEPGRRATVRIAFTMVWGAGRGYLLAIAAATAVASAAIALQLLVGRSILQLLDETETVTAGDLAPDVIALGVLMVVATLAQSFTSELRIPLSDLVERRALDEVLDVATEAGYEAYEHPEFHDRLERATNGAGEESASVVFGLVTMLSTVLVAAGVGAVLLSVAPIVVPVAIVGYLPVLAVNVINNRAMYDMEWQLTENERDRTYLESVMTDRAEAKEIRSFGIGPTLRGWHGRLWDHRLGMLRSLIRRRLQLITVGSVVSTAVLVATLGFVLVLAGRGSISLADAAVAIVGLQQLNGRLQSAGLALSSVHEAIIFLRDFERFRDELPTIRAGRADGTPPAEPTELTIEGLGYRYPNASADALGSVDLHLRRGEIVAIVGANGSGKSTLAKILCGLLPPTRGTVRWDGVDLAGCDPDLVRRSIAPVFQDYARFMFPLRDAVTLGDTTRADDHDRADAVARQAGLAAVIDAQPRGMATRLGKEFDGGIDVSIGQWQRIAIARALFRDAPVLVFDEPSASLDPQAEADLFDLLHRAGHDRIVIFISHRFATVRSADQIVVLDGGEVVEVGPHDDLMARRGLYADLFEIQASRFGA